MNEISMSFLKQTSKKPLNCFQVEVKLCRDPLGRINLINSMFVSPSTLRLHHCLSAQPQASVCGRLVWGFHSSP